MAVRAALPRDRAAVLGFCADTFGWGDYIGAAWGAWMHEGGLLVDDPGGGPVAACHAYPVPGGRAVWIEGVRVSRGRRREGRASALVRRCEELGARAGRSCAQMAVEAGNAPSAAMARRLGYSELCRWHLHAAGPGPAGGAAVSRGRRAAGLAPAAGASYVDSWRWHPLTPAAARRLAACGRLAAAGGGAAALAASRHLGGGEVATLLPGECGGEAALLGWIRSEARRRGARRVHVLSPAASLPGARRAATFAVMERRL